MADLVRTRTPAAERTRRHRLRRARGQAVLTVCIKDYFGLVNFLIDTGWLGETESEDRRQVAAAVSEAWGELVDWHKKIS